MLVRLLTLTSGSVLLVRGPSTVKPKEGGISALGVGLKKDEGILVRRSKILPFEADASEASVQVTLGIDGDYRIESGNIGTSIWRDAAQRIFLSGVKPLKILILGETDSGKSTLTAFLVNLALSYGLRVGVVDGDVGQGDLAPPGCVGASVIKKHLFDLREVRGEFFGFVGTTSPMMVEEVVIEGVKRIQSMLEDVDFFVVNTDGYVREGGVDYKIQMAREVKPNLVICIENIDERLIKGVEEVCGASNVILVKKPESVMKKPSERNERRLSQYDRFLQGNQRLHLDLRRIKISFLGVSYSERIEKHRLMDEKILLGKRSSEGGRLIMSRSGEGWIRIFEDDHTVLFDFYSLRGMFVALGSEDKIVGFGQIIKTEPNMILHVATPVKEPLTTVFLSGIRLSHNLREEYILPIIKGGYQL